MSDIVLTTVDELENYIYDEYRKYDTELNGLFFDVNVKMKEKDIIIAYANIQKNINGDDVIRLLEPEIKHENDGDNYIWGIDADLIPENEYENMYEGNCKDFLESFNDKELDTGICRIMDCEEREDGKIGGIKLDFVW